MKSLSKYLRCSLLPAVLLVLPLASQAGDAKNGEALSTTCAACHGADGNSVWDTNPKLAGQYESYLVQALKSYRSGDRQNPIMMGFAAALSDQDIEDLAAYFAKQPGELKTADLP